MKKTAVILACILILISFALAIHFNQGTIETKRKLDSERYVRLTAEENFEKATAQIHRLENDLIRLTSKINSTEKILEQTKDINAQLQEQIDRATAAQESMQQKIQGLEESSPNQSNSKGGPASDAGST
ncbi:MAG: hypothetical protein HZA28_00760 [Candidatus Omnitrophica bacterium]|nr:hypothetical protein [Candidatus Omnitrophota bacterium]